MFTGIIESVGTVASVETNGSNRVFWIQSGISGELSIGQSVAHDGVCLTVEEIKEDAGATLHRVIAIAETLSKTTVGGWQSGGRVNLERCLRADGRLDGHFVQGHVDTSAQITDIRRLEGSREIDIRFPELFENLIVERGSVAVSGTSLTVARTNPSRHEFTIALIPHTVENTNLGRLNPGDAVNLEFDILGKYAAKILDRT